MTREVGRAVRLRQQMPAQYLRPLLIMLGSCFGGILLLLFATTSAQDRIAREHQAQTVASAFQTAVAMTVHDLQDYAKWDAAVQHMVEHFQRGWIDDNVIAYLGKNQGYTHVGVIDRDDRTLYANGGARAAGIDLVRLLGPGLATAVEDVRRMTAGDPIVGGYTRGRDGKLYLFSVAAIVPLTAKVQAQPGRKRLLLIAAELDRAFIARLSAQYHLPPLALRPAGAAPGWTLTGRDGMPLATVAWEPARPGMRLRREILPGFLAIMLAALLAAGLILRRGSRAIDALRESEALAFHHAHHDALTGLPNRRAMFDMIRTAQAEGRRLAILYMDLDGFKEANDVYGHGAGDALLKEAARRAIAAAADQGGLVARAGGDEFAIMFADPAPGTPEAVAQAVLEAFRAPFAIESYATVLGVSIGLAAAQEGMVDDAELVRRADVAMYAAKAEGKNRCLHYRPAMDEGHGLRKRMEKDLRQAVEAGEIRVVFQPVIDAGSGRIVSVEALSRWTHPVHGVVPPDIFIPLAEMSGVISALGRHVLARACRDARDWGVTLAVNLSPAQFWDRNVAEEVRAVLAETGFPAERLELEITENYLLRRPDAAAAVIGELRALGVGLALDDFGTGFASIGYLRRLSFDRMKIDRSFTALVVDDPQAAELAAAIVALGRALGLAVTAEGIETQAQADIVRLIGCTRIQGWLHGAAVPADEMAARLAEAGAARDGGAR